MRREWRKENETLVVHESTQGDDIQAQTLALAALSTSPRANMRVACVAWRECELWYGGIAM